MFEKTWAGEIHVGTDEVPSKEFRLEIPKGTAIDWFRAEYDLEIGRVVPGQRYQLDFFAVDTKYRRGLLGFTFLNGELGRYVFRNGAPGDSATAAGKRAFGGLPLLRLQVELVWNARTGFATWTAMSRDGAVGASVTSSTQVEVVHPHSHICCVFGYDTAKFPNDQEAEGIGWKWSNLTMRAWAVGEAEEPQPEEPEEPEEPATPEPPPTSDELSEADVRLLRGHVASMARILG